MIDNDQLTADEIALKAMHIAGDLCVYTNHTTVMEILYKDVPTTLSMKDPTVGTKHLLKFMGQKYNETSISEVLVDGDMRI